MTAPAVPAFERILFVTRQFPRDAARADYGVFQRMQVLLAAARETARRLDVLFFVAPEALAAGSAQTQAIELLRKWGIDATPIMAPLAAAPAQTRIDTYLRPLASAAKHPDYVPTSGAPQARAIAQAALGADLVFAHRLHAGLAIMRAGAATARCRLVTDFDDIEHVKYLRELRRPPHWGGKLLLAAQVPAIRRAERALARRSDRSLVCSEVDAHRLRRWVDPGRVAVVPNSVSLAEAPARAVPAASHDILFLGAYSHRPNVEAAEYLVRTLLPAVRQRVPDARLLLVGPNIERLPSFGTARDGVEWIGFADDLDAVYARARLLCCPIFAAGGTRIKIIEAAARGVPVVSTPVGAEGLDFAAGRDILLGSDAPALAAQCVALLLDDALAQRLAESARGVAARYERTAVIADLARTLRSVAA